MAMLGRKLCFFGWHAYAVQRHEEDGEIMTRIYSCPRCGEEMHRETLKLKWRNGTGRYFA